jgi:exopolyphosphatase/guanosine-5'-triphosphate,3'-diphosphate pyrophosphatase
VFCGLGTGLGETGGLPEEAMDRAVAAILRFSRLARNNGVDRLEAFATSAVRDATNGGELIAAIHSATGCSVSILDGQNEALLSAQAVQRGLHVEDGIVADLGGGSLELAALQHGKVSQMISLPLGTMRLQARLSGDLAKMSKEISAALDDVDWLGKRAGKTLFPIGGAWRAFARLKIKDNDYPLDIIHGYTIPADDAAETATLLTGLSKQSLMGLESVVRQRRMSMLPTGLLLQELIERTKPATVTFSAVGVREGYVYGHMPGDQIAEDPLIAGASAFSEREGRFRDTADSLLQWLSPVLSAENRHRHRRRLQFAVCALSDIAWRDHPDYRASFAFDRTIEYPFFGINHTERAFIALAVYLRYGGKSADARVARIGSLLSKRSIRRAETLGFGLRLAYRICAGNPEFLEQARLEIKNEQLSLVLPGGGAAPTHGRVRRSLERLCQARKIKMGSITEAK